jgi:HAD superfamily hydrolase (TIGR01509 family)
MENMISNKLIIFDLDGVLIESKLMHFQTLNFALNKVDAKFVIDYEEHLRIYDGLPTYKKLNMLTTTKNFPVDQHQFVRDQKQVFTIEWVKKLDRDDRIINLLTVLKKHNNSIAVASNSLRETVKHSLLSLGIMHLVDYYASNQDVSRPKPHPEMFWKCMTALDFIPMHTVIIEDSPVGKQAATASGAHLICVNSPSDLSLELFKNYD